MVTSWSLGCSRLDVCRRFDRSFILSRHSEFDKNQTNSGNMKMEGSGPQSFVNTARLDCTCTLLLLPDELSGPDSAGVETKSFRLMVAKSLPMPSRPTFLVCAAQLRMWPRWTLQFLLIDVMVTSWSLGCSRLDVCRRFDRSFILSRHSEFDKNQTNSGNMKMEGSGPQSFVNTARLDCTCTLLLLPDELSGPDSAGVETKSFRLMVAKSL